MMGEEEISRPLEGLPRLEGGELETLETHPRKTKLQLERARRRQMTYFQKRREQKRRQVFFNRIRALLRVVFAVLFLYGLYQFTSAPFWRYTDPQFQVVNAHLLQTEDFKPLAAAYKGKALYEIDPQTLAHSVKQRFSMVDEVYVRRYLFPNRLVFSVLEKTPWAEVFSSPQATRPYALLVQNTRQQYQIVPLEQLMPTVKPGTQTQRVKILLTPGQQIPAGYLRQLDILSYQLRSVPTLHFQYLDATQPTQLSARFQEMGVRIGCINSELQTRMSRLLPLVDKLPEWKGKVDWIDLRWSHQMTVHKCKTGNILPEKSPTQAATDQMLPETPHDTRH